MKFPSLRTLSLALLAALFLPACSGGGNKEKGDNFVSVNAFKSGSSGFVSITSPALYIVSNGPVQNVGPVNPEIGRPITAGLLNQSEIDDIENLWADFAGEQADVSTSENSCYVNVSVLNSSDRQFSLKGMATYSVSGNMGFLNLGFDEITGSTNVEFDALIHFLGAATANDLQSSTNSSNDGASIDGTTLERIVLGSLRGGTIRMWFNFETNQALVELSYQGVFNYVNSNGVEHSTHGMHGILRNVVTFARYMP